MDIPMELDELKQAWQSLDRRLEQQNTLHRALLHERGIGKLRSRLRPLFWGQLLQMLLGIVTVIAGVWLWKSFHTVPAVLICGIVLHVYGVAAIVAGGVVLGGIARIDRSLPVLDLQQRLAKLRRAYVVSGMVVGLPWWVLWMVPPVVVAALKNAQAGVDGLPGWIWITFAACALGLIGTLALDRWLKRPGREALAARIDDAAAGGSLRRAQAELEALRRYTEQ
jgi:hypothetical protein